MCVCVCVCDNISYGDAMTITRGKIYKMLKGNKPDTLILVKYGKFYRAFGIDAYIIFYYTNFQLRVNEDRDIKSARIGFNIENLHNVTNKLRNISYIILNTSSDYIKVDATNNDYKNITIAALNKYYRQEALKKLLEYDCLDDLLKLITKYER